MSSRARLLIAFAALVLVWFGTLDYRRLIKPDEGRYAEIAREMSISGNWVTPRLNGIKYFEKPPLQYWMTAAAYDVFGPDEWTARLWPALTGFLGVLLAGFTARRLFGPTVGLYAAAILASSLLYIAMSQINTLDMGLSFFLEVAVCGFLLAQPGNRRWMLAAWAGLALAVLSKGIVALVLTGGTLILYSLTSRDWSPWKRFEFARGLPLFLLIAAPWFIAVSLANPEFPRFFFIHEHFERFLTTAHRRVEPAWYFIPILMLGALPWTTLLPQALVRAWPKRAAPEFQARRFLMLWCIVVFGFFSASGSKLPSYILPMFPALALLLADLLPTLSRRALTWHIGAVALIAMACLFLAPHIADRADNETSTEMLGAYARWAAVAAGIWFGGAMAALLLLRRDRRTPGLLILAITSLLAAFAVLLGHENLSRSNSAYHIAQVVKPLVRQDAPFYSVRWYDQTLPFYLGRTVTLVQYLDEFSFGMEHEPNHAVPSEDEFKQRWATDRDAFAVMEPEVFAALQHEGLPMTEIARDTRRVIVRKPQP